MSYTPKATKTRDLFLGRFQPFHRGHETIVRMMDNNPVVVIVKGKASREDKKSNPFDEDFQIQMINSVFPNIEVSVSPNGYLPGILGYFRKQGYEIGRVFAGADRINAYKDAINRANARMAKEYSYDVEFVETPRATSATEVRQAIRNNDKATFEKLTPRQIWPMFDQLQTLMESSNFSTLKPFRYYLMNEGGNVVFGDEEASRIDLEKYNRAEVVDVVRTFLSEFNDAVENITGIKMWNDKLFDSNLYLSGSAFHFFDTKGIDDLSFKEVKDSVGDIDTQINVNQQSMVEKALAQMSSQSFSNNVEYINFKKSPGQFITLWKFPDFDLNIQVDLEFVEFDKRGFPTDWAQFSHSSAWEDLEKGLKGVFHKFLLQSLDAPKFIRMIQRYKRKRGGKVHNRSTHAFSVGRGLREKMRPVKDRDGNIVEYEGLPEYEELSTKQSPGTTDLFIIFNHFFGIHPSEEELKMMGSFVGTIELIKRHFSPSNWAKICDAFANKLFGKGAQALYREDPQRDLNEKMRAVNYITAELNVDPDKYVELKKEYYG